MNTTVKDAAPSHTVPLPAIKEIWCGLLVVCLLTAPLRAATNLVTTTADNGPGTLRQLITDAAAGDTLMFGVAGTITLTSGELVLAQDLRIIGPGPTNLILSGNSASRILRVNSNVVAFLSGLTFRNGKAANGITRTVIDDSYITPGGPGQPGGAIYAEGIMTLQNCCVISNSAGNGGYGFGNDLFGVSAGGDGGAGGGIYNSGDLTLNKCEVAGNRAGSGGISGDGWTYSPTSGIGGSGGGICNSGILRLTDSVVSGNTAGRGGDTPRESTGGSGGNGGGVRNAGNFVATGSIISSNSAGNGGRGGVDSLDGGDGGSGGNGGGVFSSGTLAQTNCLINGNRCGNAGDGGAGYIGLGGNGGVGGSGGGLHASGSNVRLVNSWIVDNQAGFGGAGATGGMGMARRDQMEK